ncbi:hypothetical protein ACH41H_36170 [Streptomyces sp. NPDC020800]|uniref:hypothetical protein n=1 Tax=Streptomyces sp. NPDC020800 TaxID=3365092 RepID=UPI00378ADE58
MRYTVITAAGDLTHHDDRPDWDALVGHEGKVRVALPGLALAGWVNDVGLRYPQRYPRNVIGSCILIALGASVQPYAGSIVLTGWDPTCTARGLPEICSLPQPIDTLDMVHGAVLKAVDGHTPRDFSPSWAQQTREIAQHVRTAPTPGITIRPVRLP